MKLTVEDVKPYLRVSGNAFDDEIQLLMDAAAADMVRVGISKSVVNGGNPLVNTAIVCYCKSMFGFDNPDSDRFQISYRQLVTDLLNSNNNESAMESR